jgi:hypothetical protein
MTIDTLSLDLLTTEHIVHHHLLIVVLQTTLIQSQLLISHITGRDESVAEIGIDAVGRNGDMEGFISPPFLAETDKHLDIDILSDGLIDQFTPIVHRRLYSLAATNQLVIACRKTRHDLIAGVLEFEGQRGDIDGYRHIDIVGIDLGRLLDVGELDGNGNVVAAEEEERGERKEKFVYLGNHNY